MDPSENRKATRIISKSDGCVGGSSEISEIGRAGACPSPVRVKKDAGDTCSHPHTKKLSLVPGTSSLSVLTDWRRSPAHVHKSPGRAGARPSRWCVPSPFGRHAPRAAQIPRTPPLLPFRSESPQFTFMNEISLRNKVSPSYLCHNSQRIRTQIKLLVL